MERERERERAKESARERERERARERARERERESLITQLFSKLVHLNAARLEVQATEVQVADGGKQLILTGVCVT